MYWILASERSDEYELTIDGLPQIVKELEISFDNGIQINQHVPVIDILYSTYGSEIKTDNILQAPRLGLLINKKLKTIFDSLSIDNIQYYPTRLINQTNSEIDEEYVISNIIGIISCVDKVKSELELYDDGEIKFIDKLVLNLDENKDYGHIFRLCEFSPIIVISTTLKLMIEAANIKGVKIYAPEDFDL